MILVADSGSTKTQWVLIEQETVSEPFQTEGLNPLTSSEGAFLKASSEVMHHFNITKSCEKIFFYGAGCGTPAMQEYVSSSLSYCFPNTYISVSGDLLGACRACCEASPGIVGILGTGSNACFYDGHNIAHQLPSLGYLLGDEGSGNQIGRLLLKSYLSQQMPEALRTDFHNNYPYSYHQFIARIYQEPNANRFLASMAPFAAKHRSHGFIQELLHQCFSQYICNQIVQLSPYGKQISLVGSVAFIFEKEIRDAAKSFGFSVNSIIQEPLLPLAAYHVKFPHLEQ